MARTTRTATTATPATDLAEEAPVTPTPIDTDTNPDQPTADSPADEAPLTTDEIVAREVAAYRAADRSGKAKIRSTWASEIASAIDALDLPRASIARAVEVALSSAGSTKPTVTVDYAALIRTRVVTLLDAAYRLGAEHVRPVDVPTEAEYILWPIMTDGEVSGVAQVGASSGYLAGDADHLTDLLATIGAALDVMESTPARDQVDAVATARVGAPSTKAPKRDLAAHMIEIMTPGTFYTVAMIAKASSSAYGDDHPGSGAVAARLFPKVDGVPSACTVADDESGRYVIGVRAGQMIPGTDQVARVDGGVMVAPVDEAPADEA